MRKIWVHRSAKLAVFGILVVVLFSLVSLVVMGLWNWLIPPVFGWHTLTYWQAFSLLVLSKILFSGFRGGRGRMYGKRRMLERWEQMTPEEREKFREGMRARCGFSAQRDPAEKATGANS